MIIKRIYGTSLSDARQRARGHYGDSFILLEAHEAGDNGSAFISIMIENDAVKERSLLEQINGKNGNDNVRINGRYDSKSKNGTLTKKDKPDEQNAKRAGAEGNGNMQARKDNLQNLSGNYQTCNGNQSVKKDNLQTENGKPNTLSEITKKFLNGLLSPFRSREKTYPAGPVIRRDHQVLHPGVMYNQSEIDTAARPNNTTTSNMETAASSKQKPETSLVPTPTPASNPEPVVPTTPVSTGKAELEPASEAITDLSAPLDKVTTVGTHPELKLHGLSVPDPVAISGIKPEAAIRGAQIIAPVPILNINDGNSALREILIEAGFTDRFAQTLTEAAGKDRSGLTYREVRWHLESTLGKLFRFEPGSSSHCFTGLPGSGRTTLIRSIMNHPGPVLYRHLKIDDIASFATIQNTENTPLNILMEHQKANSSLLIDAPPLPFQTGEARTFLNAAQSLRNPGNCTIHIVADANLDLRTLSRLTAPADTIRDVRFSFTRLDQPGNVAKVLEFFYTSIARPGYLYREGMAPSSGIHVLLRMLDLTLRGTFNRNIY